MKKRTDTFDGLFESFYHGYEENTFEFIIFPKKSDFCDVGWRLMRSGLW